MGVLPYETLEVLKLEGHVAEEQEDVAESEENTEEGQRSYLPFLLAIAGLALLAMCVLGAVVLLVQPERALRPFRPDPESVELIIDGDPTLVTFVELSENATDFQDQRIRVTGFYLPVQTPDCTVYNGPLIHWALVSEGLQLNAKGFERPLSIISQGTTLTVEGIWRLYNGPAGCGKEPGTKNVWYLQVERIIRPNPLVAGTVDPQVLLLDGVVTPVFPTPAPTRTPRQPASETPLPGITPSPTPTFLGTVTAVTPLPVSTLTPTATASSTQTGTPVFGGTGTPTITPIGGTASATPTGTITLGTPTATPTLSSPVTVPAFTPYPGFTPPPPPATPTPGY